MRKHALFAAYGLIIISIVNCSGGTTNNNQPKVNYPSGPVSYKEIDNYFKTPTKTELQTQKNLLLGDSGCGSVMNSTGLRLDIASGFISLIPLAGPALAAVTTTAGAVVGSMGSSAGSSCVAQQLANQQYQLASQGAQIGELNNQMASSNNIIWNAIAGLSTQVANGSYTNYTNTTAFLTSSSGKVSGYLEAGGFWQEGEDFAVVPGYTIESLFVDAAQPYSQYSNLHEFTGAGYNIFPNTSSLLGLNATSVNENTPPNGLYTYSVTQNNDTLLINLYQSLQESLNYYNYNNNSNVNAIGLIQNYNDSIVNVYQNSLQTLNAVYQIMYLNNLINYSLYSESGSSTLTKTAYLSNLGSLDGTYYNPLEITTQSNFPQSESGQAQYYNAIQQNLTNLAAQMANQLYQNTLEYIVTDPMTTAQMAKSTGNLTYINAAGVIVTAESVNYSALGTIDAKNFVVSSIGNALTINNLNYGSSFQTSLTNIGKNNNSAFGYDSIIFYQYSSINNIVTYNNNLVMYNQLYGANGNMMDFLENYLPSESVNVQVNLLTTANGSFVESALASTDTIQPYYIYNGYPQLFGNVTNNISACNGFALTESLPLFNFYIYTPNGANPSLGTSGVPYLMCGNWSTANMPANAQFINTNESQVTQYYSGLSATYNNNYAGGTTFAYTNTMTNNPTHGYSGQDLADCIVGYNGEVCGSFPTSGNPITLTNFNAENWTSYGMANNAFPQGGTTNSVFTGWMNYNYPSSLSSGQSVSSLAAAQINLPDGFIAPIILTNTNIKDWKGNYAGIGYNPNIATVTINGQPLYNLSQNVLPMGWGPAPSTTRIAFSASDPFMYVPAINVNGNTIMMNSNTTGSNSNGSQNTTGAAYLTLNPENCPNAISGPFSMGGYLIPNPYNTYSAYQATNFICNFQ